MSPRGASVLIAIDLETTGLDPREDEIVELGAVKFTAGGEVVDTFEMLARPTRRAISSAAQAKHGITRTMVNGQPGPLEVWSRFVRWADGCTVFVAHVAKFEARFLRALCQGHHDLSEIRFLDTRRIAQARLREEASYRLADLVPELGAHAHRALPDAAACAELYIRLARTYKSGTVPFKTYAATVESFGWYDEPTRRQRSYIESLGGDPDAPTTRDEASDYIDELRTGGDSSRRGRPGGGDRPPLGAFGRAVRAVLLTIMIVLTVVVLLTTFAG